MAIIYNLSTGKVISENEVFTATRKPAHQPEHATELQAVDDLLTPEESNPCDAYMVLLQRLLKDL